MRIICYGDSNTYGYDPRDVLGRPYPDDVRWTGLLRAAGIEAVNQGLNGREIPVRESVMENAVRLITQSAEPDMAGAGGTSWDMASTDAADPDLAIIMLGTNDVFAIPDGTAEDVTERMRAFLEYIIGAAGGLKLMLIAPPAMKYGEWATEDRIVTESERLGECYKALAAELGIEFADAGTWGVELSYDGVHFTAEGHRSFAHNLIEAVSSLN